MLGGLKKILEEKEKKNFIFILVLMVGAGFLEAFSIGILVPFISFLVDPAIITTNSFVIKYIPILISSDYNKIIIISLSVIFIIFLIKFLYLILFSYLKNILIYNISDNISIKIFSNHIVNPYFFHLKNNSSNIIQNCMNDVEIFIDGVLLAGLGFISEIILILFIVLLLFFVNPIVCLFTSTIGLTFFLIFKGFTNSRLKKWSLIRQSSETQMIEKVQQGFGGIKEIAVFLKERFFIDTYSKAVRTRSAIYEKYQTLIDIPKIVLELVAVIIFVLMIYLLLKLNKNLTYFIPIIGLYVGASFKLLPALARVIVFAQKLKRSSLITSKIYSELKNYETNKKILNKILTQNKVVPLNFKRNIILKDISFKYPGKNKFIFENINLNIKKGETIGIIGKSGEGKSTLVNILCGFIIPTTGSILVDNIDIQKNLRKWRAVIGYIPQTTYLFNDTISNNISFYSENKKKSKKRLEESIRISQLETLIQEAPLHKETMVGERGILLSGGQVQRVALARTIYKDPQILILDEATSSLDAGNEKAILEAIKSFKRKKTIIMISHRERTLSFCDKIYRVQNKKCEEVTIDKI